MLRAENKHGTTLRTPDEDIFATVRLYSLPVATPQTAFSYS